ncbi:MAG: CDP-alcohol phosphatidyltransferase family protein [Promethearchaeota archaeon]
MPSKLRVRYIFRPLVKVIAHSLSKVGVTPNIATSIMLLFSIFSLFSLVFLSNFLLFSILVFTTGIFDGVDGEIARLTNKSTKRGAFFDSTMDRISEFIIFMALLLFFWNEFLWIIDMKLIIFISFLASIMISYTRARAENFCKDDFDIGLMARSERLFYLVVISFISFFYNYFKLFLFIFMWLVTLTALFRFIKFKKYIKKKEIL